MQNMTENNFWKLMFFFSFYVLHLARTFVTLSHKLFARAVSTFFSSIKWWSPKSNDSHVICSKLYFNKVVKNRFSLIIDRF